MNLSRSAADILHPVNLWETTISKVDKTFEDIKNQVSATLSILTTPEVIKSEMITAFRKVVKQEAENCVNCNDEKELLKLNEILKGIDLASLVRLTDNHPVNNINYQKNAA